MQIYIHIPFCQSKCPYCAFGSLTNSEDKIEAYFKALKIDILENFSKLEDKNITSIFFGGGTPSVVKASFYKDIFKIFESNLDKNAEISSEANPNSASLEWLNEMKNMGLNRISFGAQSFNEKKLKFLGRIHGKNEIYKAVSNARKAGFENINLDFIYGTKFDNEKLILEELLNLKTLKPNHISAYSLTIEENTPFAKLENASKDDEKLAKFAIENIINMGYSQYEISNFGQICKHNLGYWQGNDYAGFGAFSVGTLGQKRLNALDDLEKYIKNPSFRNIENLSEDDIKFERIFLGLRSILGVDLKLFNQKEKIKILKENNKIYIKNERIFNTNFLLADEISLFLTCD